MLGVALLVGACGAGTSPSPSPSEGSTTGFSPIDQMRLRVRVASMAREMLVPGAVALVRSPAGEVSTTYGTSTVGGSVPVSLADHVRIGSITKTWTGTVILQQAHEGKLKLDDPVSKYRADVPDGDHITIAELLNMRSGLYNYTETRELNEMGDSNPQKVWTPDELLALSYSHRPYFPPGAGYHYSNTNTVLLGLIAETLDGKPLSQVFQDRLFTPLGLKDTHFPATTSSAIPDPHPHGYMYGNNVLTMGSPAAVPPDMQAAAKAGTLLPSDQTNLNPSWAWAGGAGISTAADLALWAEALAEGKLLDPDTQAKRIASLQSTDPAQPDAPQYGLAIAKFGALYGHTGEVPGFNTFAGADPQHKVTIVVWVNLDPTADGRAAATLIAEDLINEMYGSSTATPTR
ncbi:D-alanyl-D-alanine carboxypeptidase [Mycobacteriaceae bacterium 1482268.1]|nr:D-alanyl-D-alanine carboxypeptidase [Mycobacteriaceae bacterium 1482268.1]